jgi:hypothetical protein
MQSDINPEKSKSSPRPDMTSFCGFGSLSKIEAIPQALKLLAPAAKVGLKLCHDLGKDFMA